MGPTRLRLILLKIDSAAIYETHPGRFKSKRYTYECLAHWILEASTYLGVHTYQLPPQSAIGNRLVTLFPEKHKELSNHLTQIPIETPHRLGNGRTFLVQKVAYILQKEFPLQVPITLGVVLPKLQMGSIPGTPEQPEQRGQLKWRQQAPCIISVLLSEDCTCSD